MDLLERKNNTLKHIKMIALVISLILLGVLYASSLLDSIPAWLENADFEEEPKDLDDSEYDWSDNIKNYKKE